MGHLGAMIDTRGANVLGDFNSSSETYSRYFRVAVSNLFEEGHLQKSLDNPYLNMPDSNAF